MEGNLCEVSSMLLLHKSQRPAIMRLTYLVWFPSSPVLIGECNVFRFRRCEASENPLLRWFRRSVSYVQPPGHRYGPKGKRKLKPAVTLTLVRILAYWKKSECLFRARFQFTGESALRSAMATFAGLGLGHRWLESPFHRLQFQQLPRISKVLPSFLLTHTQTHKPNVQ